MEVQEEVLLKPTVNRLELNGNNLAGIIWKFSSNDWNKSLNFNFSYKDYFKIRREIGFSSIGLMSGFSTHEVSIIFTDKVFKFQRQYNLPNKIRCWVTNTYQNYFYMEEIPSFCGGFRIHTFDSIIPKEQCNFMFQFVLEEFYGKCSEMAKARTYPIFFNDKANDGSGRIKESLKDPNIEGTLKELTRYINPNSKNNVGMYMYQIETIKE